MQKVGGSAAGPGDIPRDSGTAVSPTGVPMVKNGMLVLLIFFAAGCSTVGELKRLKSFEATDLSYRRLILRSDLESAERFVDPAWHKQHPANPDNLNRYQITGCEVKEATVSTDRKQVVQVLQLSYYRTDLPVEKTIRIAREWRYDEQRDVWMLTSGLPPLP